MNNKNIEENKVIKKSMEIEIGFPDCVRIELVQSNDLRNYEIFLWLSSLFSTAAAGFWVSFASGPFNKILLAVSLTFTLFTFVFGGLAVYYRKQIGVGKIKKTMQMEDFK